MRRAVALILAFAMLLTVEVVDFLPRVKSGDAWGQGERPGSPAQPLRRRLPSQASRWRLPAAPEVVAGCVFQVVNRAGESVVAAVESTGVVVARTQTNGWAEFEDPGGMLFVTAPGYMGAEVESCTGTVQELELHSLGSITLHLANAKESVVMGWHHENGGEEWVTEWNDDAKHKRTFDNIPPGQVTVFAFNNDDGSFGEATLTLGPWRNLETTLALGPRPTRPVVGRVETPRGFVVGGASVQLRPVGSSWREGIWAEAHSDLTGLDGSYSVWIPESSAGEYQVLVDGVATNQVTIGPGDDVPLVVTNQNSIECVGRNSYGHRVPIRVSRLSVSGERGGWGILSGPQTHDQGLAVLVGKLDGPFEITLANDENEVKVTALDQPCVLLADG